MPDPTTPILTHNRTYGNYWRPAWCYQKGFPMSRILLLSILLLLGHYRCRTCGRYFNIRGIGQHFAWHKRARR
jgi:hypothetical protein